ncbi:hypothetical protein Tco_1544096 [Tanacetum coccineum]
MPIVKEDEAAGILDDSEPELVDDHIKVPSSILKSLESIRSRFLNGQDPKSNKASWVKWNKVLTPKDKGG